MDEDTRGMMLIFQVRGPMPEGLVELCKVWGMFRDG